MTDAQKHRARLTALAPTHSSAWCFSARSWSFPLLLTLLLAWLDCGTARAQKDLLYEETLSDRQVQYQNQIDAGALYSGAESRDLDDGAFGWDYIAYGSYRYRLDDKNVLRLRYQYWNALTQTTTNGSIINSDEPSRHVYELAWTHRQNKDSATTVSFAFLDQKTKTNNLMGTLYLAQQGVMAKDALWFAQAGAGMNNHEDYHGDIYLELVKPLSVSTLLRCRNETFASTDGTVNNTFRLNVIQGLTRKLAVNAGYRLFANSPGETNNLETVSHEGSVTAIFEARDNLFFSVGDRYYWNDTVEGVNSVTCEGRWSPYEQLSLVGGYQLQRFHTGLIRHGFRGGLSFSF
jgi:hypothetical protein